MKKELEFRSFLCEVRAEETDAGNIITGRPIVYNSRTDIGYFDEIIEVGALDGADLNDVRFLLNHDLRGLPMARSRRNNGNSTMLLEVDLQGMLMTAKLDTVNNADSRALWSAVQRGDISGMSFMFSIDSETWEDLESDHPTRRVNKIGSVVEVSAVTFPAYSATEINARSADAVETAKAALERARESIRMDERPVETGHILALLKEKTKLY